MLESRFQRDLILDLKDLFEGCLILKNDSGYIQGVPDLLILFNNCWAALEVKSSLNSRRQPNQDYYIDKMNDMSFAAYISPENKEDVLHALQRSFQDRRPARLSQR